MINIFSFFSGQTPSTIQNLFFVPVPIFSLDIKKVLDAFLRSPDRKDDVQNAFTS